MNFAAREGIIRDFDDPAKDMQILLASMKCGGGTSLVKIQSYHTQLILVKLV